MLNEISRHVIIIDQTSESIYLLSIYKNGCTMVNPIVSDQKSIKMTYDPFTNKDIHISTGISLPLSVINYECNPKEPISLMIINSAWLGEMIRTVYSIPININDLHSHLLKCIINILGIYTNIEDIINKLIPLLDPISAREELMIYTACNNDMLN